MTRVGQLYRENLINRIKDGFDKNSCVFLLSYSNVSSIQVSDLRKSLSGAGAEVFVSKNSLARIALKKLKLEELADKVSGQLAFIWSTEDSVEISKILIDFSKPFDSVSVQGGLLDDKILSEEEIKTLSELPSKSVLRAMLLGTIQAPVTQLLGAFNAKSRDLLSILKQYGEQKGGQ